MLRVPSLEENVGIEVYASQEVGIGGIIKQFPEDFVVEEILIDGSKAEVSQSRPSSLTGKGRYLVCVLIKRDWDTLLVVKRIAQELRMDTELVDFAGLKDTRALTAQHISLAMTRPEQLEQVKIKDVELRPIGYSNNKISTNVLFGNQFKIIIRAVSPSRSVVRKHILKTRQELENLGGAPNFFGHQRFGTARAITHLVGKALVKGNVKEAVFTYLAKPSRYEHPEVYDIRRQLWHSQDFQSALRDFPQSLKYERIMLHHLTRHPKDFEGAFRRLPLRLRQLFIQAYQSYLFNRFLSRRLRNGTPLNCLSVGDYIAILDGQGLPIKRHEVVTGSSNATFQKMIDTHKAKLALPIIGFKQESSGGLQGEIEQAVLESEGIDSEVFKVKRMPELSSSGGLRMTCVPLIDFHLEEIAEDSVNPSKRVLRFSFTLLRGSYATVVLREFMKSRNLVKAGF